MLASAMLSKRPRLRASLNYKYDTIDVRARPIYKGGKAFKLRKTVGSLTIDAEVRPRQRAYN